MKKMTNAAVKLSARLALAAASRNVNSTCSAVFHQPKLPTAALKLKK